MSYARLALLSTFLRNILVHTLFKGVYYFLEVPLSEYIIQGSTLFKTVYFKEKGYVKFSQSTHVLLHEMTNVPF